MSCWYDLGIKGQRQIYLFRDMALESKVKVKYTYFVNSSYIFIEGVNIWHNGCRQQRFRIVDMTMESKINDKYT